jgi:hypothetical protein
MMQSNERVVPAEALAIALVSLAEFIDWKRKTLQTPASKAHVERLARAHAELLAAADRGR